MKRSRIRRQLLAVVSLALLVWADAALAVRVKDIAALRGARDNQLIGFGIVVGLDGTGDSPDSLLARKPIVNALERIGISLGSQDIQGQSVAAVWLTATLPPFAKSGQQILQRRTAQALLNQPVTERLDARPVAFQRWRGR